MTQIEKLYQSIQQLKELGVQLPVELINETNRVEEEIIKNDVIPALADAISPLIEQIQRELILVVEYVPNEPLSVKLTRKRSLIAPAEVETLSSLKKRDFVERGSFSIPSHSKSSKTVLRVKFQDGKEISNRFAYESFIEAIKVIGIEKVKSLGIFYCGVPLVSNKKDDFYNQHELANGIFIMTHSATKTKKEQLDFISKQLNLGLKVEII